MKSARAAVLRPAQKSESRRIAELYRISSDGVADYIWTGRAAPGEDALDVGERRYARENTDFSYQNVTVAVVDSGIVGMLAAYPMGPAAPGNEFDFDIDPVLKPFAILEQPSSFYISGVAVFPEFRGCGIGGQFMESALEHARVRGLALVSLIVFGQNVGAKRLYDRLGFHVAMREPIVAHPLIHHTGDALLMVKTL